MNSSTTARLVLGAAWLVFVLVLTAAQLRVVRRPPPRRVRYAIAWAVSTLVLGALITRMDLLVGRVETRQLVLNFVFVSAVAALALAIGDWWTRRPAWAESGAAARFLKLAVTHAIVVTTTTYPFI